MCAIGREFAGRRNPVRATMSRVYAVEATPTLIGAAADHRYPAGPAAHARGRRRAGCGACSAAGRAGGCAGLARRRSSRICKAAQGRAFVHAGADLPAEAHALIHAINEALGGRGQTYDLIEPPLFPGASMAELRADMEAGQVEQLLVLDCNAGLHRAGVRGAMRRVPFSLSTVDHAATRPAAAAHWFVPLAHPFETWGDARGT